MIRSQYRGFTLIELIVVMGIIAILATIVIVAVNPGRQLAQSRNTRRQAGVTELRKAINQYIASNNGIAPTGLNDQIKTVGTTVGAGFVNLTAALVPSYLSSIPFDPDTGSLADTGYLAYLDASNRPHVSAPGAELGETIIAGETGNIALTFDGVDDSVVYGTSNISTPTAVSVEIWAKPTVMTSVRSLANIGAQSATVGYHWLYIDSGTSLRWQYANGTTTQTLAAPYTFAANQWYHITLTHDYTAKQVKAYINGALVSTLTHVDTVTPVSAKNLSIGRYNALSSPFAGSLDEPQVYNRVLTPVEVADHASRGQSPTATGLLVGYHFDEGTGASANDYSTNNRDGAVAGALWSVH